MEKYITKSEAETLALGEGIAKGLKGGEVIGLEGELGAGKTVLVRGLARGLGIKKPITSPTFNIMKVYPVKKHRTIKKFVHIDAYRLESWEDLFYIGIDDYLNKKETVVVIEWIDRFKKLPEMNNYYKIELELEGENKRRILLK